MVKGTLVFEFSSALDLENQLRAYLKLPQVKEIAFGEIERLGLCRRSPTPKDAADTEATPQIAARPQAPEPEATAAEPASSPAPSPAPEVPQPNAPEMTPETLAAADHKTLVAFVDAHPEVGVTLTEFQRGNNIWRDFVAQKIKNWLESK